MFFKRKPKETSNTPQQLLQTDMHSHLLPGIDDGSPDLDTSVQLIKGMMAAGYKNFITTPHVMWDMYQNTTELIIEKEALLNKRLKEEGIDVSVKAAAEYFIDDHVQEMLRNKEPMLTLGDNMVLVEFSMASPPFDLKDVLFELQLQGYAPVIAHPERYIYLENNKDFYAELKDAGYYFQLNALSLAGHYGRSVADLAAYLAKKGYYDLVGTDLHHFRHLDALPGALAHPVLMKLMESGKLLNKNLFTE
jgi:tyrosine-protein phosphatase YwqE